MISSQGTFKAGFHMIADNRKKSCFHIYNRNDRRDNCSQTFRSAEMTQTRAPRLKSKQHGGRRLRGSLAASELISSVCHEATSSSTPNPSKTSVLDSYAVLMLRNLASAFPADKLNFVWPFCSCF